MMTEGSRLSANQIKNRKRKSLALLIVLLFICCVALTQGKPKFLNRDINIQCPVLDLLTGDEAILRKINKSLYEHSVRKYYDYFSVSQKSGFSLWHAIQYTSKYKIKMHNEDYLSVFFDQYVYPYGAAHGHGFSHAVVYDVKTGEELSLEDIMKVGVDYRERIMQYYREERDLQRISGTYYMPAGKYILDGIEMHTLQENSFYLTETGLVLLIQTWDGGNYTKSTKIPLDYLTGYLKTDEDIAADSEFSPSCLEKLIPVEGGTFTMGNTRKGIESYKDAKPAHEVTITYDFLMAKTEITNAEFLEFLNDAPISADGYFNNRKICDVSWNGFRYDRELDAFKLGNALEKEAPAVNVTWWGAIEFCDWLSRKRGLQPAYGKNGELISKSGIERYDLTLVEGFRIPTEAEWEYAAKGGQNSQKDYIFSGSDAIDEVAWYWKNSSNTIHTITQKKPNALGLYDMSGNAREWCYDAWDPKFYQKTSRTNPVNHNPTSKRVTRGGDWSFDAFASRVFTRTFRKPADVGKGRMGFRIVLKK